MKNLFWLLIFCGANLISYFSYSQIKSFPYSQDFETDFIVGEKIEFIPGWIGNEIEKSSRIYKSASDGVQNSSALVVTPTSSFGAIITLNLNFKEVENPVLEFQAKSLVNGTGTYHSKLEVSFSVDNGETYSTPQEIGAGAFTNSNTDFISYSTPLESTTAGKENILLQITIKRGSGGTGTAAKVVIDDFKIYNLFVPKEIVYFRDIQINEFFPDPNGAFSPDSAILPNTEFVELFNSTDKSINLKGFSLNGASLAAFDLLSKHYVIVCPSNAAELYTPFGSVLPVSSWNTLTNSGEKIILRNKEGGVVDSLIYDLTWYKDKKKQEGGWSLEQINPQSQCNGIYNFQSSTSTIGATPGFENSVSNVVDTQPADVLLVKVIDPFSIQIHLNKPISKAALSTDNFKTSPSLTIDQVSLSINFDTINVSFVDPLTLGKAYSISIQNLETCSKSVFNSKENTFGIGVEPGFNELIITEIIADPSPTQGLPETEFIEILNRSQKIISLKDVHLSNETINSSLPNHNIYPGEYLIVCPSSSVPLFNNNNSVIGLAKWPTLLNDRGKLYLKYKESLIYSLEYFNEWHEESKSDGGFALEMIDVNSPCLEKGNWTSSLNERGGTPGQSNSIQEQRVDLLGPEISEVEVVNDTTLILEITEKLGRALINVSQISAEPTLAIKDCKATDLSGKKVRVILSNPLEEGLIYTLTASGLTDCADNVKTSTYAFALPQKCDSRDIVINEILFNPRKGGVDFVELFNRSDKYLSLPDMYISRDDLSEKAKINISKKLFHPKEFIVLTTDKDILKNEYPALKDENVFELVALPSMPDEAGSLIISDSINNIIDSFSYSDSFHLSLLRDTEGVSLERISTENETQNQNNWHSASADVGFATPGFKNSQEKMLSDGKENFVLTPTVFSPDGDGYDDYVLINYSFANPGTVGTIKIFDRDGRKVKTLINNQSLTNSGFIQWDGMNDQGQKVQIGLYMVYVEVYNLGGKVERLKKEVVVAGKI